MNMARNLLNKLQNKNQLGSGTNFSPLSVGEISKQYVLVAHLLA